MILLFDIKNGVLLDNHKHPHTQFGYCFEGHFDFTIDGTTYKANAGDSYLIEKSLYHSAIATSDYYSMDFKYISQTQLENPVSFGVLQSTQRGECNSGVVVSELQLERNHIVIIDALQPCFCIQAVLDPSKQHYVVVSRNCVLNNQAECFELKPMRIYEVTEINLALSWRC